MRIFSFLAISASLCRSRAKIYGAAHGECAYAVSSHNKYSPIPDQFALKNLVVIHRHGDRAQISREIGPNHPETPEIKDMWQSKLPSKDSLFAMAAAAEIPSEHSDSDDIQKKLYTGWDHTNSPYGQLTQLGAEQLFSVGVELRRRYVGLILPEQLSEASKLLYCRSTNFCRTHQSLRSLLAGLLEVDSSHYPQPDDVILPSIFSKPKEKETMYPQADGPCPRMNEIRTTIFANDHMANSIPGYNDLESRMKELLGYTDRVSWLTVKEILTCYATHNIPFPDGITDEDAERVSHLAGWMWGELYTDDELNRLAIGRFLREMLDLLKPSVLVTTSSTSDSSDTASTAFSVSDGILKQPKIFIYSGHDSTIVPILCALGIYDGVWPPYSSYLALEVAQSRADPSSLFVRAIYNDDEQVMLGCSDVWCPYDKFINRLEGLALAEDTYKSECSQVVHKSSIEASNMEINEDIKAVVGGSSQESK